MSLVFAFLPLQQAQGVSSQRVGKCLGTCKECSLPLNTVLEYVRNAQHHDFEYLSWYMLVKIVQLQGGLASHWATTSAYRTIMVDVLG